MPVSYRELMANDGSSVIDFYPSDFKQDLNGKKFGWQAIAVLPFIDAVRLQSALAPLKPQVPLFLLINKNCTVYNPLPVKD
ncbi:hypothetical protein T492DRAFT_410188 [Pavlovales sp. CCMP2436]|nr:hypothetical protein T492DRAFT_410188 [Pavlovales sp. CCMP2436]